MSIEPIQIKNQPAKDPPPELCIRSIETNMLVLRRNELSKGNERESKKQQRFRFVQIVQWKSRHSVVWKCNIERKYQIKSNPKTISLVLWHDRVSPTSFRSLFFIRPSVRVYSDVVAFFSSSNSSPHFVLLLQNHVLCEWQCECAKSHIQCRTELNRVSPVSHFFCYFSTDYLIICRIKGGKYFNAFCWCSHRSRMPHTRKATLNGSEREHASERDEESNVFKPWALIK